AGKAWNTFDRGRRVFVPPARQVHQLVGQSSPERFIPTCSPFAPKHRVYRERLFQKFNELLDAMVVNAALRRWKQAELPLEAENIPRIDQRSTADTALNQLAHLIQRGCSLVQQSPFDQ